MDDLKEFIESQSGVHVNDLGVEKHSAMRRATFNISLVFSQLPRALCRHTANARVFYQNGFLRSTTYECFLP